MKKELQVYKKNQVETVKNAAWNALAFESQKAYGYDFKLFFEFIKKKPEDVTASDIMAFLQDLENKGYKNSSINRKVASLSKMFKVLKAAGEISENPVEMLKQFKNINMKTSKEVRNTLTMKDIRKAVKITKKTTLTEKKLILIIRALAKTGLRISELIHIKYKDMETHDKQNKIVRVVGKGNKERFIYFEDVFLSEIQEIFPVNDRTDYLFYNRRFDAYDRREMWKSFKIFFKKKLDRHVHPHQLRHTFATHKIFNEKRDIKAVSLFLGHHSCSITLDAYVSTSLDSKSSKVKI